MARTESGKVITEGRGRHAPIAWKHQLDRSEQFLVREAAERIANYRGYGKSANAWKRGLSRSIALPNSTGVLRDDVVPFAIGLAGEVAVAIYLGGSIDDCLRHAGDSGNDLVVNGVKMQIKTRRSDSSTASSKHSLVRVVDYKGRNVTPTSPLLVLCELGVVSWQVSLLGWLKTSDATSLPQVKARQKGHSHLNVEVPDSMLEPMPELRGLVKCH